MKLVSAVAALLFISTQAHAIEYGLMKNEFGFDAGPVEVASSNDFHDGFDSATVYGGHFTHFLNPRIGIGLQFDHIEVDGEDFFSNFQYTNLPGNHYVYSYVNGQEKMQLDALMATGRLNIWERGLVIPYLMAGLGVNHFVYEATANAFFISDIIDPIYESETIKEKSIHLSGTIGLGLDIMISEVFRLGGEVRYTHHEQKALDDADPIKMTTFKSKVSWYFN